MVTFSVSMMLVAGCDDSVDNQQAKQTQESLAEANRQIGMPNVVNFQQRKLMKMIYELMMIPPASIACVWVIITTPPISALSIVDGCISLIIKCWVCIASDVLSSCDGLSLTRSPTPREIRLQKRNAKITTILRATTAFLLLLNTIIYLKPTVTH